MELKKITFVIYNRNDEYNVLKTLQSILEQKIHKTDYNVIIFDDFSQDDSVKTIKKFIKKNEIENFNLIQFDRHLGISNIFAFMNRARLIKSEYVTFLRSGDEFYKGWIQNFFSKLYLRKMDMYIHNFDENLYYEVIKQKEGKGTFKKSYLKKIKNQPIFALDGEADREEVVSTIHIFFGKIFKYSKIQSMNVYIDRILYQDFYIYQKMIALCSTFYYSTFIAGSMSHKPWYEQQMDKERIILLCKTLDKMISSKNVVLNGLILQMLAIAIKHTNKLDYYHYIISNFKNLHKNYKLMKVKGIDISSFKARRITKNIVKTGKLLILKK